MQAKRFTSVVVWAMVVLLSVFVSAVRAAGTGEIRGEVLDATTREPIPAANVVLEGTNRGAAADLDGDFVVANLEPGTYHVTASALGYEARTVSEVVVRPNRSAEVQFRLQPSAVQAEEVVVTAGYFTLPASDMPTSARALRYEEVRRAPGAAEDVQRMIQALPGVAGESDQNNEIVVRGGSPSENLIVLDGIEVENINHFGYPGASGGPINAVNAEFLNEVTFASGGFSARYGDKLSSVLDLDLREGSRQRVAGSLDLNMAGAGGSLEGPINEGKGSFLLTGHRSYLDLMHNSIGLTAVPQYWSTQGKVAYDLSDRHKLDINALYADDWINISGENKEEGGYSRGAERVKNKNRKLITGLRLRSLWGVGYTDLVLARSSSFYTVDVDKVYIDSLNNRTFAPWVTNTHDEITYQASLSWTGRVREQDEWSFGIGAKPLTVNEKVWIAPDSVVFDDGTLGPPDGSPDSTVFSNQDFEKVAETVKTSAFAQYTWRPSKPLAVVAGVRYDGFDYTGNHVVGPRLSMKYDFLPAWRLSLAYGIYYQTHPFFTYDFGYTYDGAPENADLPYARADQYIAGLSFLPRPSTKLSVEAYYKDYSDLLVSKQSIIREQTRDFTYRSEILLPEATKEAWGVEFFAHQKMARNWYGTFSYSYGIADATTPAYGTFPTSYDYRHVATVVLGYSTSLIQRSWYRNLLRKPYLMWMNALPINGDELTLSTRYRYISGRPCTGQVWLPEGVPSTQPYYEGHWERSGDVNNRRYPAYSRWDIRVDNKHYFTHSSLVFYLEVQNVLDEPNVASYSYAEDGERDTIYQFRFFFVGGVRFEF